jgi:hypothetical protein
MSISLTPGQETLPSPLDPEPVDIIEFLEISAFKRWISDYNLLVVFHSYFSSSCASESSFAEFKAVPGLSPPNDPGPPEALIQFRLESKVSL